jgi:lipopolysaccharide transport system permease protein
MQHFSTHIKSETGLLEFDFKELYKYKDLIFLFVKRNFTIRYKQTILGPLWQIINPLLTVLLYTFVFGNVAGLSTDGVPHLAFYLCSNALWSFFASIITTTAGTFTANASILGKVYFPRLVMPISSVLTATIDLIIQIFLLGIVMMGYLIGGYGFDIQIIILLVPVIWLQTALLGMGCGIIIASLTTKYRDLNVLVSFGIQLWMYASPVVYTVTQIPAKYSTLYMLNPMAYIMTSWRHLILGTENAGSMFGISSWIMTIIIFLCGVLLFNKIEKTFMDTV